MNLTSGRISVVAVILATVGCDRVTKQAATAMLAGTPGHSYLGGTVRLGYAENLGGFLGLGAGLPPGVRTALFTVAVGVVLCGLALLWIRRFKEGSPTLGLALLVAGGASNWIDRVTRGGVVDFLNLGVGPVRTGVFNVADVAIMIGAFVFVLEEYRRQSPVPGREAPEP